MLSHIKILKAYFTPPCALVCSRCNALAQIQDYILMEEEIKSEEPTFVSIGIRFPKLKEPPGEYSIH